ncbi:hypothetical protein [Levilactobacillus fujinensis]|uniref:Uncharacterized protein n=1 Tax=Levilactobacillus fujinensis TaxID=2486024 RepID=A0ABW1TGA3_9LACO|nr:hypothetical protein [Levilactobacillus fujinensis]
MSRKPSLLQTLVTITPSLTRWTNYEITYIVGLPAYLILIVLNCRFIVGKFIFNWDTTSWYFTLSFWLLLPVVRILLAKLNQKMVFHIDKPVQRLWASYFNLVPSASWDPSSRLGVSILLMAMGIVLAPVLLIVLSGTYGILKLIA